MLNKWLRGRKKWIAPVEIVGRDEELKPEAGDEKKKIKDPNRAACVRYVKLVFGNNLRVEKYNLGYHELKEQVERLEGLC